jgi:hypothetical protein
MTNKKKRSNRPRGDAAPTPPAGGANPARRERKEEARRAREQEMRRLARRNTLRRGLTFMAIGAMAVGAFALFARTSAPRALAAQVTQTAAEAGCSELVSPAGSAPGGIHLSAGQQPSYETRPATSGAHSPNVLPVEPRVKTAPVDETLAVHTLEHGSVIVYHRLPGEGGPTQDVLDRLAPVAENNPATYLIPYPEFDGADTAVAFTAWNKLMTCPAGITSDQAAEIAQGFVDSFACTSNAPEGRNGDGC